MMLVVLISTQLTVFIGTNIVAVNGRVGGG